MSAAAAMPTPAELALVARLLAGSSLDDTVLETLNDAVREAVRTLKELLKSEQEKVRLQAARLILDAPRKLKALESLASPGKRNGEDRKPGRTVPPSSPATTPPPAAAAPPVSNRPRLRSPMEHRTPGLRR